MTGTNPSWDPPALASTTTLIQLDLELSMNFKSKFFFRRTFIDWNTQSTISHQLFQGSAVLRPVWKPFSWMSRNALRERRYVTS